MVAFWASLALRLPTARVPAESSPDKDRLLAFVRERGLDRTTLQVHASWGTYYDHDPVVMAGKISLGLYAGERA